MPTKERMDRIKRVLSNRFADIRVVLEEVKNAHNAGAVARTCDAAGVQHLDIISADNEPFPVNEAVSTRAHKWLEFAKHTSTSGCLLGLKERGFTVFATYLGEGAVPYSRPDYRGPSAFVFGNEADGISEEARDLADVRIRIPMLGMTRSLNLSVSVGIILYEVIRHRYERGSMIITSNRAIDEWYPLFGDELMASAAMDRLLHHAHVVVMEGDSFRNPPPSKKPAQPDETEAAA